MKGPGSVPGARFPNFLVIGAMKSGTTSLYHYLRAHPQVYMPDLKEVDFFTAELNWGKGWRWYAKQFAGASAAAIALGEASTSYTKFPRYAGVAERIAASLPDVRLIYVVRDPIERMRSHYRHNVALGEERAPIDEALLANPAYLDCSRYALQLQQYLDHFPRENFLIFRSEDLRSHRVETMRRVLAFLAVDPDTPIETLDEEFYKTEERGSVPAPVAALRRGLKRVFPRAVGLWRGRFVPDAVKKKMSRTAGTSEHPAVIGEATRAELLERLQPDVARLRAIEPSLEGWGSI